MFAFSFKDHWHLTVDGAFCSDLTWSTRSGAHPPYLQLNRTCNSRSFHYQNSLNPKFDSSYSTAQRLSLPPPSPTTTTPLLVSFCPRVCNNQNKSSAVSQWTAGILLNQKNKRKKEETEDSLAHIKSRSNYLFLFSFRSCLRSELCWQKAGTNLKVWPR